MTKDEAKNLLDRAVALHEVFTMLKTSVEDNVKLNISLAAYDDSWIHIDLELFRDIIDSGISVENYSIEHYSTYDSYVRESSFMYKGYKILAIISEPKKE